MLSAVHRWFEHTWQTSVEATATALFPPHPGAPDFRTAELVPRTIAYVEGLPPSQRPLLKLLFVAVEWLTPVLAPFGGRFSRRSPARRLAIVERWRHSWLLPHRLVGDALRATLVMVYYSHPDVQRALGEPPEGETMLAVP